MMIINNNEEVNLLTRVKSSLFNFQLMLIKNQLKPHSLMCLIITILSTFPMIAVLVQNSEYTSVQMAKIFNIFLISGVAQAINIKCQTMQITIFSVQLICILTGIWVAFNRQSAFFCKLAAQQIMIFKLIMIPIIQFQVHLFLQNKQINYLLHLMTVSTAILCIVCLSFTYFHFTCLRSNNSCWKLQNRDEFYACFLNIARLLVIIICPFNLWLLTISLTFELYKVFTKHSYTKFSNISHQIKNNLIILVHLALIISNFTKNQLFGLQTFAVLAIFSLVKCGFDFIKEMACDNPQMPLCTANSFEFYDYYFRLKEIIEKSHSSEEDKRLHQDKIQKILSVHELNCNNSTCLIGYRTLDKDDKLLQVKKIVKNVLIQKAKQSKENDFVNMIWSYEVDSKMQIYSKEKELTLQQEFIIHFIETSSKQMENFRLVDNDDENATSTVNQFYFYMNEIMKSLSNFYTEIGKAQINVIDLITKTKNLKQNSEKLQIIYSDLVKKKQVTFKMAEIYLQYKEQFVKTEVLGNQKNVSKNNFLQNTQNSNQIQQINFPALAVYPETGNIENFNMELLSLIKYSRSELKAKNIDDIIKPRINLKDPNQIEKLLTKGKKYKIFLLDSNQKQIYINLQFSLRMVDGVRLYFLIFKRQKVNENKNIFLVNKRFQIQNIQKQESFFKKSKDQIILMKWRQIFSNHILSNKSQLIKYRIAKIRINQCSQTLMIVTVQQSTNQNFFFIGTTLVVDIIFRENRVSIMAIAQSNQSIKVQTDLSKQFNFYYTVKKIPCFNNDQTSILAKTNQLFLIGSNQQNFHSEQYCKNIFQLGIFQKDINQKIVEFTLLNSSNLTKGIKTYRLYENELYNVDLEDKQAYLQQFQSMNDDQQAKNKDCDQSSVTFYLSILIVSVVTILIIFVVFLGFQSLSKYTQINTTYSKIDQIQIIRIATNQMNGIIRDVDNGLYAKFNQNWKLDLNNALNVIKQTRNQTADLFSTNILLMTYQSTQYNGTLNELLDVILAKFHLFANTQNMSMIPYIQNASINCIAQVLYSQKDDYVDDINKISSQINTNSNYLTYASVPCLLVFFVLMAKLFSVMNDSLNSRLLPFLRVSDKQAKYKAQNAQKISYVIEMADKKFDIDLKNILNEKDKFQERRKNKNTTVGLMSKVVLSAVLVLMIGGNIGYLQFIRSNVTSQLNKIQDLTTLGSALLQVYIEMAAITNKYSFQDQFNKDKLAELIAKMDVVEGSRQSYPFSAQNNQLFLSLLYDNICSPAFNQMLFANRSTSCEIPTPYFQIQNPYQIGIDYYLRRMHYNIVNNITDTYGSTGVFSFSFATIFQYMARRINQDGSDVIQSFENQYQFQCIFLTLSYFFYIFGMILIVFRQNSQLQRIKSIVNILQLPKHKAQQRKIAKQKQKRDSLKSQVGKSRTISILSQQSSINSQQKNRTSKNQQINLMALNLAKKSKFSNQEN